MVAIPRFILFFHHILAGGHAPFLHLVAEVHAETAHARVQVDQTSLGASTGGLVIWAGLAEKTHLVPLVISGDYVKI